MELASQNRPRQGLEKVVFSRIKRAKQDASICLGKVPVLQATIIYGGRPR